MGSTPAASAKFEVIMRTAYIWNPDTNEDVQKEVGLFDGAVWAESVLDDMENANWHSARSAFEPLIRLLPRLYAAVDAQLKQDLEDATDPKWSMEF